MGAIFSNTIKYKPLTSIFFSLQTHEIHSYFKLTRRPKKNKIQFFGVIKANISFIYHRISRNSSKAYILFKVRCNYKWNQIFYTYYFVSSNNCFLNYIIYVYEHYYKFNSLIQI